MCAAESLTSLTPTAAEWKASLAGCLKQKLETHLCGEEEDVLTAMWAMISAHNEIYRVGGYSPSQWVFGREMSDSMRRHDGPDTPFWSSRSFDQKMQKSMSIRLEA